MSALLYSCVQLSKTHESAPRPNRYDIDDLEGFGFITSFAWNVRQRLALYENFKIFLCGIHGTRPGLECRLPLLDQGKETALAYKTKVADYVGFPRGKELRLLRQASEHLSTWGF
jgi:hypothetical protein